MKPKKSQPRFVVYATAQEIKRAAGIAKSIGLRTANEWAAVLIRKGLSGAK